MWDTSPRHRGGGRRPLVRFADALGIRLYQGQREILQAWAGSGRRKAVLRLGRCSGKGVLSAIAAIYNALVLYYDAHLRPGELRFIVVVATREQPAREFIRVVRELLRAAPDPSIEPRQRRERLHRRRCRLSQRRRDPGPALQQQVDPGAGRLSVLGKGRSGRSR